MTKPFRLKIQLNYVRNSVKEGLRAISEAHHARRVLYDMHEPTPRREGSSYHLVAQRLDHPALDHLAAEMMPGLTKAICSEMVGYEHAMLATMSAFENPIDQDVPILKDWKLARLGNWEPDRDPFPGRGEARGSIKKLIAEMAVAHARHQVQTIWRGETKDLTDASDWEFYDDFASVMTEALNTFTMKPRRFGTFGGYLVSRSTGHAWLPELDEGRFDLVRHHGERKISMAALQAPSDTDNNAPLAPTF